MKRIIIILLLATTYSAVIGQEVFDYLLKGRALIDAGKNDEAITVLSEAANLKTDYRIFIERASAYRNKRDYDSAITDFQKANSIENNSGSYGLAQIFALKGDAATSLTNLNINLNSQFKTEEKVIMLDPSFRLIENTPEWRLFWRTERLQDESELQYLNALTAYSEEKYSETITLLSGLSSSKQTEKVLRLLAKAQFELEQFDEAAMVYGELINNEIIDAELLYLRAECFYNAGEEVKAISDVNRYLILYPENAKALSLAGKLELLTGDNLKAIEYFTKNININPAIPENYIDRANSYFNSGSWKYAIEDYSMALDLQPASPEVYLNKGIALINLSRTEDACHDLRMALKLGNRKASSYISKYCIK